MARWVRRFLEMKLGKVSVDERLVAAMERYAQANGLDDDEAGRDGVLQVATLMVQYGAAPRQLPKDWPRGKAIRRLLSKEEKRRGAATAIAVGVAARKRLGSWDPPLTRNGRSDDQLGVAVAQFLARAPAAARVALARDVQWLAGEFGWSQDDAILFILAGVVRLLPPVRFVSVTRPETAYGTVLLEVQPWVSPETVKAIYTEIQRQLRGHRQRAITLKALDRFVFAYRKRVEGDRWPRLFDQYCRRLPRRERTGTWRQFQRDCRRTENALLHPNVAPAFKVQAKAQVTQHVAAQVRLAAEAGVGPLVALTMGITPAQYEAARQRQAPSSPTRRRSLRSRRR